MNQRTIGAIALLLLLSGNAVAAVVSAGSGSYTDTLPAGKPGPQAPPINTTAAIKSPVPTNDWWTSLVASVTPYRLFAFPQCYRCDPNGLLVGYPTITKNANSVTTDDTFIQQLLVQGVYGANTVVTSTAALVDGYSDWTVTTLWKDQTDPSKYFRATFGHGLVFNYFEFANGVSPQIIFPLDWHLDGSFNVYDVSGNPIAPGTVFASDHKIVIEFVRSGSLTKRYFGVFAPAGASFALDNLTDGLCHQVRVTLPAGKNYLSVGLMTDKTDLAAWYNYAYAFVKDTKVSWSVDTSKSSVQTTFAVTTEAKQGSQSSTLLALMPHQWKNSATLTPRSQNFSTLRGIMKVISGTGFTVTNKFQGIVPFLPDRGDYDKTHVQSLLTADAAMTFAQQGTYWHGKELNKLANLIPLAGQMGEDQSADSLAAKLETDLINWFTYTPGENYGYFYYDRTWGSLIGYTPEYGLENFTDQHFHFGYFVNASSLLSLYDKNFATAYGPMVELLIRSYASPFRDDALFPFLRTFDPYEGHSWADGHGTTDSGNNQESSAEAMNSWAAIYLWGLSTGNATYRDLGIWGYTTEYSAIKEYYFDIDHSQYAGGYNHNVVGILWGGKADYGTWFGTLPTQPEDVHGIQILPLNASMLYQGYDTAYALANYNQMVAENGGTETTWQDTFWKFQSLFDPAAALAKYNESIDYDSANSKTSTYHWLHDFNVLGTVDTSIYADCSSYAVFTKAGQKTFVCFNPSATGLAVKFYRFSDNGLAGTLQAPPHAMVSTTDFTTLTVERLAQFASGGAGQGLSLYYATESWNVTVAVPQGSFSGTVNMSVTRITPPAGDGTTMRVVPVGFQVVLDREVQPSRDITITVNYTDNDIAGFDEQRLVLGRYDEGQQLWVPLSSVVSPGSNQVIGRTSHLSRFALLELAAAQDLNGLRVYPNPYRPGSGTGYDRAGGIVFSHLTAQARIRIYTVAGELVFEGETDDGTGNFEWKAVNACGQKVASGVYVYVVTAPSGEIKKGKIAIEK